MGNRLAQIAHGDPQLFDRATIVPGNNRVDFLRELRDCVTEADQFFSRRKAAQPIAHFRQAAFDNGERRKIAAGLTTIIEPAPQFLDLELERLQSAPRQRFGERLAHVGKLAAKTVDRGLEVAAAARPHPFDSSGELA